MDKLNQNEISTVLKDVRSAYRLLALYQKRLLDVVKYVGNKYGLSFHSGWSKFSNPASHGTRASIDKWSWDWLSLYLYEFNLGTIEINQDLYRFKILHQGDTGFFDASINKRVDKQNVEEFEDTSISKTRLFFIISKNADGCPIQQILEGNLSSQNDRKLLKGDWLAIPYEMERFSNQTATDLVISEFNNVCKRGFGIDLLKLK